jgi:hypothetical protein
MTKDNLPVPTGNEIVAYYVPAKLMQLAINTLAEQSYKDVGNLINALRQEAEAIRDLDEDDPEGERSDELYDRVQFLVNNWPAELEDGGITFPDGVFWPQKTDE